MLIGMLFALAIVCILFVGPTFDNILMAIIVYGGLIVAMILAFVYSSRLSSGIAGFLMGGPGGKADTRFQLAEKYEIEHRYNEAIETYMQMIAKDKKDALARLKLADLYAKLRDHDNCMKYLEEAVLLPKGLPKGLSENERINRINRLADMYLKHKRDRRSAVKVLRVIVNEHPKSRYAVYARERIVQIKKGA